MMQSDTTVVSIAAVFFTKGAIIIATHCHETLHWQLSKVILCGIICGTVILRQWTKP